MKDAKGHGSAAHQAGVNSIGAALKAFANGKRPANPYTPGGMASAARARRTDKASAYVAGRAARSSNFKLG